MLLLMTKGGKTLKKNVIVTCLLIAFAIILSSCKTSEINAGSETLSQSNTTKYQMIANSGTEIDKVKNRQIEELVRLYYAYFKNKDYSKAEELCTENYNKYVDKNSITASYSEELIYISEIGFLPNKDWYYALVGVMSEPTVNNPSYGTGIKKIDYEYLLLLKEQDDGTYLIDEQTRDFELLNN